VAAGAYTFQLQSASASGNRSADLGLRVATAVPSVAALTAPANHSDFFFVDEGALPLGARALAHLVVDFLLAPAR